MTAVLAIGIALVLTVVAILAAGWGRAREEAAEAKHREAEAKLREATRRAAETEARTASDSEVVTRLNKL